MPVVKQTELEPGFLQAFRLYIVTRIVFWIVIGPILIVMQMAGGGDLITDQIISLTLIERLTLPNVTPVLVMELVLLVLLVLPQVPRILGRWFVPFTLLWGLVPILIGFYWWPSENPLQNPFAIFFFVMLVLVAWQYPFRYVLAYVLGLTLYQLWLIPPLTNMPASVDVSWLILQAAMMLLVGYVIVQLVSIQRGGRFIFVHGHLFAGLAHDPDRKPPEGVSGSADPSANDVDQWGPYSSTSPQNAVGRALMRNILEHAGVDYRLRDPEPRRFTPYLGDHMEVASISANIAYNNTPEDQRLTLRLPYRPGGHNVRTVGEYFETDITIPPFSYVSIQPERGHE